MLDSRISRRLEQLLLATGVVCLAYFGYMTAEARQFQREQTAAFEALLKPPPEAAPPVSPAAPASPAAPVLPVSPGILAMLEIPRLNLSTPVISGDDDDTLEVAVGHLPDTPLPWEPGNSALAGHRDGLFRPLRNIKVGDDVRVRTTHGEFVYRVRETKVVTPDDLSVLAPADTQRLTLITCYPFNYVGHAPKRFIVHADLLPRGTQ